MRTTLTIDDDNAVRLERLRKERDVGLKDIVNDVIRRGLDAAEAPPKKREPFRTRVFKGGEPLFRNPQELKDLIERLDVEEFLEKTHKPGLV
jgi:hypothetical protein